MYSSTVDSYSEYHDGRQRPWYPVSAYDHQQAQYRALPPGAWAPSSRREASESSVEALDLADYARTLRQPHPQPPPTAFRGYPSAPSSSRPRAYSSPPSWRDPGSPMQLPDEDLLRFPVWSRPWYEKQRAIAEDHAMSDYGSHAKHSYESYPPPPSVSSSHAQLLPWSSQLGDEESYVPDDVKEERMRMLEAEFGPKAKGSTVKPDDFATRVGGVSPKGNLITAGPKKRASARWAQALLSLLAAVASIYAALFIHNPTPPPPANKLPAFALYVLSAITFSLLFYLFFIRPCCCGGKRQKEIENPSGIMVMPVAQALSAQQGKDKGNKGKKGGKAQNGTVQVNLIVDPTMFGTQRGDDYGDEADEQDSQDGQSSTARPPPPARRSRFTAIAEEQQWKRARGFTKRLLAIDVVCAILWGAEFVLILFGKRCPAGGFQGWCNAYNIATASSCLLCLVFICSVVFSIRDLTKSQLSPRTHK